MSSPTVTALVPRDIDTTTLLYNPVGQQVDITNQTGAFLGNGKIGLVTHFNDINVQNTMITRDISYASGAYIPNIIEPFHVNKISFFSPSSESTYIVSTQEQNLNMVSAIFTASFHITNYDSSQVTADMSLYLPRHLPFCIVQTININLNRASNILSTSMDLPVFHEVSTGKNLTNVIYNNNVIFNTQNGTYILSGTGIDSLSGHTIAFASAYLFERPPNSNLSVNNVGFNVYRNNKTKSYNSFIIRALPLNTSVKMHIITAMMTDFDFSDPIEEVKRIVINAIGTSTNIFIDSNVIPNPITKIRSTHVNQWSDIWKTNITITPKTGTPLYLSKDILAINQVIRAALYNIYSSTRENINTEINPLNLSVIDQAGMVMYEGDTWFIPVLTIFKPDVARALLEYRYKTISFAQQLSAGYGYSGTKYPYLNDVLGYKNALYYDISSPLSLFNNALISVNVWNYYRVTKDKLWLESKGYPIMKSIADFFTSCIQYDSVTNTYSLDGVTSFSIDDSQNNNGFTNNLTKLALKYAIEASYELGLNPHEKWKSYFFGLPVSYINQNSFSDIIKVNDSQQNSDKLNILDILFILVPFYSELYFTPDIPNHSQTSLKRNLDFYIDKINTDYLNHPYNTALLAIVYGLYAQTDPNYVVHFDYYLHLFIMTNVINNDLSGSVNNWLNMKCFDSTTTNSLISNSVFLLMMLQAIPQINIQGGVSSTRFYYKEMQVSCLRKANMPGHWANITVNNLGGDQNFTCVVQNQLLFTSQVACTCPSPP